MHGPLPPARIQFSNCAGLSLTLLLAIGNHAAADEPRGADRPNRGDAHVSLAVVPDLPGIRRGEPGFRALYTVNRNGGDLQFVFAAPGMISTAQPEWSHDGTRIACDAVPRLDAVSDTRLFVATIAGPSKGEVQDLGFGSAPTWSPDDKRLAYLLAPGNSAKLEAGIWMMNADGSERRRVCAGLYPDWSPDGRRLCVDAGGNLLIKDLQTGDDKLLLPPEIRAEFAGGSWSPKGDRVVFIAHRDNKAALATIEVDGGIETLKTISTLTDPNARWIGPPSWSPDGKKIVFALQDTSAPFPDNRMWMNTWLYTVWADLPNPPVLLESKKIGHINRGMTWSRDGQRILFSSER